MTTLSDYQPTAEFWALLTLIAGGVGRFFYDLVKRKQDRLDREQDRLDRAQLATLTIEQLEAVKASGGERLKVLVKEVQGVKQVAIQSIKVSKEAIKEANNYNSKIAGAVEVSRQVLEKLESDKS
jgi:hypothetical protein